MTTRATCLWRIAISLIIPEDFPSWYDSAKRNLVVLFIHFNGLVRLLPRVERLVARQTLMHEVNLFKLFRMK
jgi:hypothetical protein